MLKRPTTRKQRKERKKRRVKDALVARVVTAYRKNLASEPALAVKESQRKKAARRKRIAAKRVQVNKFYIGGSGE